MNNTSNPKTLIRAVFYIIFVLVLFLISIDLLVASLTHIGKDSIQSVLEITANPFVSLFIGLLITAVIQSSSTTTSMIVAMVASGSVEMQQAIPMIMGANIGTTLTSNIVSLNFITKKKEFRRAFSTAALHDHFNILVTLVLFPLQYYFNFLGLLSQSVTEFITLEQADTPGILHAGSVFGKLWISEYFLELIGYPVISLTVSILLLFGSIKLLTNTIYKTFIGTTRLKFESLIFKNPLKSFGWGAALTASIQSSSVTTSLVVPLVATGKINFKDVYPFIVGANIGTTITALLAALLNSPAAISIAVAHLLFNLIGGVIFFIIPGLNKLPILLSRLLGDLGYKYRIASVLYIILIFFILPFVFIYMTK